MKKIVAAALILLLLCGSAICDGLIGTNQEKDIIAKLEENTIELEATLSEDLSEIDIMKVTSQLMNNEACRVALMCTLEAPDEGEVEAIRQQIDDLNLMQIDIQALIDSGNLLPGEIAAFKEQLRSIEISQIVLKATIEPLTEEEIQTLVEEKDRIQEKRIEIEAQLANGGLPEEEIALLEQQIDDLNTREIVISATSGNDEKPVIAASTSYGTSEILFRGIPWLISINDAVKQLGLEDVSMNGRLRREERLYSWGIDYTSVYAENAGFEYSDTNTGNSLFVAGHSVGELHLWALYDSTLNSVNHDADASKFYKATYYFDGDDKEGTYWDLFKKLSDLYGSPSEESEDPEDQYAIWYGENNTGVILRKQIFSSTAYLSLSYGRTDADAMIADLKAAFESENHDNAANGYEGL